MPRDAGLARYNDFLGPHLIADLFRLTRGGRTLVCTLTTHPLGWELRASSGEAMPRTQVCKTENDVFTTAEAWQAAAVAAGWTE